MTDREPLYYLQDSRSYVGNCPMWWGVDNRGYTTDLNKAQKYTLKEAMGQHEVRPSDIPWPCDQIDALARPTLDIQDMNKTTNGIERTVE